MNMDLETEGFEVVRSKKGNQSDEENGEWSDPEERKLDKAWLVVDMYLSMKEYCEENGVPLLDKCESSDLLDFAFGSYGDMSPQNSVK